MEPAAPPVPHPPRFPALKLLSRRPLQRADGLVIGLADSVGEPVSIHAGQRYAGVQATARSVESARRSFVKVIRLR